MTGLDHRERYVVEAEKFCEVVPNGDALTFADAERPNAWIATDTVAEVRR